ncbi:large subunit ribosomal protein L4 [Thermosulfidibacter takaii ABI70S6]|uniref:Large ribosomal subunit protein uL4 n=1 Tax=Thermosulfidibacter takaii (strain DSM 17441 / JCM 13301 / NBRC 103674 / ABI70S6) TaxID=1298851 RepID=A0A0S3QV53_THET7|nr:50S ribosomal protein L4 [Thermosulfidibacter takaii]BAT72221.1 large subunit ribosomal protein L4 [Thermosulfidibacter takaii ABI70S6]
MEATLKNINGQEAGTVELNESIFNAKVNRHLMWEAVRMQLASRRAGTACTKTRGEVRGGGRKPWPQKGTGRARQGSIRAPHWVGGGVVFGPKPRDYSYSMPKKAKRAAVKSALTARFKAGDIIFLEGISLENHKTKAAVAFLKGLGIDEKKVLIVVDEIDFNLDKSTRNIPYVKVLKAEAINVYDVLNADVILITKPALDIIEERLAS